MTNDRDPTLERLFASAGQDPADEAFTARVMTQIDRQRRKTAILWLCVAMILTPAAWLLGGLLQEAVLLMTQVLPAPVFHLDPGWAASLLAPVNSVAGVAALTLVGLRMAYRRLF